MNWIKVWGHLFFPNWSYFLPERVQIVVCFHLNKKLRKLRQDENAGKYFFLKRLYLFTRGFEELSEGCGKMCLPTPYPISTLLLHCWEGGKYVFPP